MHDGLRAMYSINGRNEFYIRSVLYAGSGAGGREGGARDDTCGVIIAEVIKWGFERCEFAKHCRIFQTEGRACHGRRQQGA